MWCGRRRSRATVRLIAVAGRGGRRPTFPPIKCNAAGVAGATLDGRARPSRERSSPVWDETPIGGSVGAKRR